MIRRLGAILERFFRAVTPEPFVLAIVLTLVTGLFAVAFMGAGLVDVIDAWGGRAWSLLSFGMQMCLVLVTGHALAQAPAVEPVLDWLADRPQNGASAAALVALVAVAVSFLNWGLCLIVGALFARQMGRRLEARQVSVHYPLLAAAGYTGMMTWHGGFSGSAPLKVTTQAALTELLGEKVASGLAPVPVFDTILSPMNLVVSGGLLVLVPLLVFLLSPRDNADCSPASHFLGPRTETPPEPADPNKSKVVRFLEDSRFMNIVLVVFVGGAAVQYFLQQGIGRLNPNVVNLCLLSLGLLLHPGPRAYARAIANAVSGTSGIILQFPLYAGIMGIMAATGLAAAVAQMAASAGSGATYSVFTFFSAGLLNLFVPSGGGQWAVQGPIAAEAAQQLGLPLSHAVMAVAYGDQWSNMLQPFWALPLLGITAVKARDIVGYTATIMMFSAFWFVFGLVVFAP